MRRHIAVGAVWCGSGSPSGAKCCAPTSLRRPNASTVRPSSSTMRTHASAPLRGELRSWDTADGIQKLFTRFGKWSAKLDLKKVLLKPSPQLEFAFVDGDG